MFSESINQLKIALRLLLLFTLLTGIIYPFCVTIIAQLIFPSRANGSLIVYQDKIIGSKLIGQLFSDNKYFWGRPSATTRFPYNASNSGGSNLGPSNPNLLVQVKNRIATLQQWDSTNKELIPIDLVTASGSGLDPEISVAGAYYQIPRIAKARRITSAKLEMLLHSYRTSRFLGILGEPRFNVLELNLALDQLDKKKI